MIVIGYYPSKDGILVCNARGPTLETCREAVAIQIMPRLSPYELLNLVHLRVDQIIFCPRCEEQLGMEDICPNCNWRLKSHE